MIVGQTSIFARQKKKLRPSQIQNLDEAVRAILDNPTIGEQKKVRVFKFKMVSQQCLLAYQWNQPDQVVLLALEFHENSYRDLKRVLL